MTTETKKDEAIQLKLQDVRIARVSLKAPFIGKDAEIGTDGKPKGKYHADLIIPLNHPQLPRIKELMRAAVVRKFKSDAEAVILQIATQDKSAMHKGDVMRAGKPEYAGKLYISASNPEQPNCVVTENGINLSTQDGSLTYTHQAFPYAGSHDNVIIDFWAYDHPKGGKGVSCTLLGVQFLRHDKRLAGTSVAATSEFGLVASEADAPAPAATATAGDGLI
jgi:hypothetical protein